MKRLLLRLYPRRWRRRYEAEMARLLDDLGPLTPRRAINLLSGALDAHLTLGATMTAPVRAALRRALLVAAIVWLVLSIEIVLTNVVFPQDDDGPWPVVSYLAVFVALGFTGRFAARVAAGWRTHALAGGVTGALIGSGTAGTFLAVDNVFLSIVAQQQGKIDGLAASGMTSMRAYVNSTMVGALVFWTVLFAVTGVALAVAGGSAVRASHAPG